MAIERFNAAGLAVNPLVAWPGGVPHHAVMPVPYRRPRAHAALLLVLLVCVCCEAWAAGPKRVLILHSFGRDFAPYDTIVAVFRTELARRSSAPIDFIEANLDIRRAADGRDERVFVDFLNARFDAGPPDVVVTIGPPAARFYTRHRAELFEATPVVFGALDRRLAQQLTPGPDDFVVAGTLDFPALFGNILRLLPQTETVSIVAGNSDLERFWAGELKRELAQFEGRVKFDWLNDLSLTQMQVRVANLPPNSAVFYALLIVDAAGVPHERQDAFAGLRQASTAPIFSIYESELGKGVVGGPYTSQRRSGETIARAALRALGDTTIDQPRIFANVFEPPVYDWRELRRWNIDPALLPPGSEVRFRPPSVWEEHRVAIAATVGALLLQAILIAGLLVQRAHRRRAEGVAHGLAGRLVTAHEDERRRLARELHDDVTQRLAGLAIEAAELEHREKEASARDVAHSIRSGLVELGEDVHALSYRLHPSVIEDLGLVEALKVECERVAQSGRLRVTFDSCDIGGKLPPDAALCLFRVAQEALRNVERHAKAESVDVRVVRRDGGVSLAVRDDGSGFDVSRGRERASLGLASMRERVRLLGGKLDIESKAGEGTSVLAWVPDAEVA
ncbi:MAG: sensor histidine kinase [Burkholderiales bacterium]